MPLEPQPSPAAELVDFIAREAIDMVKKECAGSKDVDLNDPAVVRDIIKGWLENQNLKRRIWQRVKHHTRTVK